MYIFESTGKGDLKQNLFDATNGYANGKHWMDITVKMWKEDIKAGLLSKWELYLELPGIHWWLDESNI